MIRSIVLAAGQLGNHARDIYVYFQILRDLLGADKAVLLRHVQSIGQLVPYLATGLSTTTIANLRVSPEAASALVAVNDIALFASLPDHLKSHFSLADSDVEQSVLVCGIENAGKQQALFVWIDNPYALIPRAQLDLLFSPIRDMIKRFIISGFGEETYPAKHFVTTIRSLSDNAESRAKLHHFEPAFVITLKLPEIVTLLRREYQFLSPEAALRDISSVVHKACFDFPMIDLRNEERLYLCFKGDNPVPADVIASMLCATVSLSFMGSTDYIPQLTGLIAPLGWQAVSESVLSQVTS